MCVKQKLKEISQQKLNYEEDQRRLTYGGIKNRKQKVLLGEIFLNQIVGFTWVSDAIVHDRFPSQSSLDGVLPASVTRVSICL